MPIKPKHISWHEAWTRIWEDWKVLGLSLISIIGGLVVAWISDASVEHKVGLTIAAVIGAAALTLAGRRVREAEDKLVPRFTVRFPKEIPEIQFMRDQQGPYRAVFHSLEVTNECPETISGVTAHLQKIITPVGRGWSGNLPLNWRPTGNEQEPKILFRL